VPINYYPVDSAIAMRDKNGSNVQVTVMNDRPQGGSADLSDKATIELMQHRRQLTSNKEEDLDSPLNEANDDSAPNGIRVTALYNMQIFDTKKGSSLQRQQQIRTD
jgi:hypothetical protein